MRPQKLKIKGLNSFIEEQNIDFSQLVEKGLFGIFGPTGSGKSTILDAITLALYGKIARDTKEFINTECDDLSIRYEFVIGKGDHQAIYAVERNLKKEQQSYRTTLARLCEIRDGQVHAVLMEGARPVEKEIEKIIGLNCDDFTRSVVLPQGKFSEFLKLTGTERRNMLERIFRLETYGKKLRERIRKIKKEKQNQALVLETQLGHYHEISEELLQEKEKQYTELELQEAQLKKELEELNERYEKYKVLWEVQKELLENQEKQQKLVKRKEEIEASKEHLIKARHGEIIKPYIDDINHTQERQKKNQEILKGLERSLETIVEALAEIEKRYEIALDQKNTLYPKLLQKEANLQQAIQLEEQVKEVEEERKELVKEYQKLQKEINTYVEQQSQLQEQAHQNEKNLDMVTKKMNTLKITPEEREMTGQAFENEKRYREEVKQRKENEEKRNSLYEKIKITKKEYQTLSEALEKQKKSLYELEQREKELEETFPGGQPLLFERKTELDQLSNQVKELEKLSEQKEELTNQIKIETDKSKAIEKTINELRQLLAQKKQLLVQTQEEVKEIEIKNLASVLGQKIREGEPCPVCGSIHHPDVADVMNEDELEERRNTTKILEKEVEATYAQIGSLEVQWGQIKKEEEYLKKQEKENNEKMKDQDLDELHALEKKKMHQYEERKTKIEQWEIEKKEVEEKISKIKETAYQYHTNLATLQERLHKDEEIIGELQNVLQQKDELILQLRTKCEKDKEVLHLTSIEKRVLEIKKFDVELVQYQKKETMLRDEIQKVRKEKEKIDEVLNDLKDVKGRIEERGQEKRKTIDRLKMEIHKIAGEINLSIELEKIQNKIKEILEEEEIVRKKQERLTKERQEFQEQIIIEKRTADTLRELNEQQRLKLNNQMKEKGFLDIQEVLKCIRSKEEQVLLENAVNQYEDEWKNVKNNMDRLQGHLKGERIKEEQWIELIDQRQEKIKLRENTSKEIAVMKKTVLDIKEQLKKVKELVKKKKKIDHIHGLLDDLDKLIQGNKFVEYVALYQLDYIAKEASKTLKNITKGRYALELDSNGNFIMRDDFNGGTRRDTNTLSGGETFLTSLALALALSSQIQLKNRAPLEFFFLDEGFGTLDQELLDIVMGALERLHTERLAVGIISHVEELKNRIPVKLIVSPSKPGMGGSKVRIEYS